MTLYEELVEETIHMYFLSPSLDLRVQNREAPVLIRALILPEVSTTSCCCSLGWLSSMAIYFTIQLQKFCDFCGIVPKVSYCEGSRVFRAVE